MTDLFFCPERWEPDEAVSTNIASMIKVHGAGITGDAWQLGDWGSGWTAITSKIPIETGWLEPGAEYRFCFWLNGGENSRGDEVCTFEIFGDAWEDRLRFRLNRDHTKPLLEKNGWLLFAVPFTAPEAATALTFRFVAAGAVCTVAGIHDMNMTAAESIVPDERDLTRPQRHNIVFRNGYPDDTPKVRLKARGRELEVSRNAVRAAAAAGVAVGALLLLRAVRKPRK